MKSKISKLNISKIIIFILIFLILFQDSFEKIEVLGKIDELFVILIFLYDFISILFKKKLSFTKILILIGILLFSLVGILSCYINSSFILSNVLIGNFLAIKFFLLIYSFVDISVGDTIKNNIISSLELIAKIVALVGIFNFVFPNIYYKIFTFAIPMRRFGFTAVTSLFYHTGRYGWFMLFISVLYFSKFIVNKNNKDRKNMILYCILSLLSFRTKVIVGIITILIVKSFFDKKINFKYMILTAIVMGALFLFFGKILNNTYNLYFNRDYIVSARQSLNDNSIKILKEYFPLGVGFGKYGSWYASLNYSEYYYKYGMNTIYGLTPYDHSYANDTFWPAIIGETGFIGTIIYVLLITFILIKIKKSINSVNVKNIDLIYLNVALFGLIQSICESFGEPSFNSSPQNIILGIFIGISLNIIKFEKEKLHEK